MKKNSKIIISILFVIFIIVHIPIISKAGSDPIENPNAFQPGGVTNQDINAITGKANNIIGVITTVGVVISVVTMIVLGIKYMMGSVEERADYQKSMIPYLIGVVLLLTTSVIVKLIATLVQDTNLAI